MYHPNRKANAIRLLDEYDGDIPATSARTGIPPSTLYRWRREHYQRQAHRRVLSELSALSERTPTPDSRQLPEPPAAPTTSDELPQLDPRHVRNELLKATQQIVDQLQQNINQPQRAYQYTLALTRLMKQISQLNDVILPPEKRETRVVIGWKDPDDGLVYDKSFWHEDRQLLPDFESEPDDTDWAIWQPVNPDDDPPPTDHEN